METPNKKRRPVIVVSRDEAIPVLNNVVAPDHEPIRHIPTFSVACRAEGVEVRRCRRVQVPVEVLRTGTVPDVSLWKGGRTSGMRSRVA